MLMRARAWHNSTLPSSGLPGGGAWMPSAIMLGSELAGATGRYGLV
jgi:hypothetical protein